MQQLISIETVPIQIEYVEKEPRRRPSRFSSVQTAELRISQQTDRLTIQSNPISIPLRDTFEQSAADDWGSLSYTATAQYSRDGKLRMNIRFESPGSVFHFQQYSRGIDQIIDSLSKSADPAFHFESMQINFDMSYLPGGMPPIEGLDTSFLPPDLELKVVERPQVIIKYVGGPIYIPKSADPNYEASDRPDPLFAGKAGLNVKA